MTDFYYHQIEKTLVEEHRVAKTRARSLGQAMREIHKAVCHLDDHNLNIIRRNYPEIIYVADYFARPEDGLRTFTRKELNND
tara:strand:+ start:1256 stop:1501 length:246 start_codon:yes stop_codon:yes gene_type:complete